MKEKEVFETMTFKEDFRNSNPGLHHLYVTWFIKHLHVLDKAIKEIDNLSSTSMVSVQLALYNERKKLVEENAAYYEANEILKSIGLGIEE